jgi:hypothetical protein
MSLQGPKAPKGSTVVGSSGPLLDLFIQYHQIPILIPKVRLKFALNSNCTFQNSQSLVKKKKKKNQFQN